jgi:hypothetical protein
MRALLLQAAIFRNYRLKQSNFETLPEGAQRRNIAAANPCRAFNIFNVKPL